MRKLRNKLVTNTEYNQYQERKQEWIKQIQQESESDEYDERKQAWLRGLVKSLTAAKAEPKGDVYDVINTINSWSVKQWAAAEKQGSAKYAKDLLQEERENKRAVEKLIDWSSKRRSGE